MRKWMQRQICVLREGGRDIASSQTEQQQNHQRWQQQPSRCSQKFPHFCKMHLCCCCCWGFWAHLMKRLVHKTAKNVCLYPITLYISSSHSPVLLHFAIFSHIFFYYLLFFSLVNDNRYCRRLRLRLPSSPLLLLRLSSSPTVFIAHSICVIVCGGGGFHTKMTHKHN